jgi:hypothetical protein
MRAATSGGGQLVARHRGIDVGAPAVAEENIVQYRADSGERASLAIATELK